MDVNGIMQLISTLGFPIVMCVAMAYYIKYINDKHSEELKERDELHRQETENLTQAVNNNTLALTKLLERMDKE